MKNIVEHITRALVDHPEKIVVKEFKSQNTLLLQLKVAKEDVGKIIGKQGRSANAIRTVLSCAGAKANKKVFLEIIE